MTPVSGSTSNSTPPQPTSQKVVGEPSTAVLLFLSRYTPRPTISVAELPKYSAMTWP